MRKINVKELSADLSKEAQRITDAINSGYEYRVPCNVAVENGKIKVSGLGMHTGVDVREIRTPNGKLVKIPVKTWTQGDLEYVTPVIKGETDEERRAKLAVFIKDTLQLVRDLLPAIETNSMALPNAKSQFKVREFAMAGRNIKIKKGDRVVEKKASPDLAMFGYAQTLSHIDSLISIFGGVGTPEAPVSSMEEDEGYMLMRPLSNPNVIRREEPETHISMRTTAKSEEIQHAETPIDDFAPETNTNDDDIVIVEDL